MCGLCFRAGYSTTRDMDLRRILGWIVDGVEKLSWGFPGGPVVTDPPAKAGGRGFDAWSGKTLHVAGQLSLCAASTEPVCCQS